VLWYLADSGLQVSYEVMGRWWRGYGDGFESAVAERQSLRQRKDIAEKFTAGAHHSIFRHAWQVRKLVFSGDCGRLWISSNVYANGGVQYSAGGYTAISDIDMG